MAQYNTISMAEPRSKRIQTKQWWKILAYIFMVLLLITTITPFVSLIFASLKGSHRLCGNQCLYAAPYLGVGQLYRSLGDR
jgi:uncharacterized membrane protein